MIVRKEVNWKGTEGYRGSIHTQPWVNVKETEASFWVEVAAPGLAKSDFGIEVKDQTLLISVEKELGEEAFVRQEFDFSRFKRAFYLPKGANRNQIQAKYEAGILTIEIPKQEEVVQKVTVL
jgi:HSP20 family protein